MDMRVAAVKCLIKILEQNTTADEAVNYYAEKVCSVSELINLVYGATKFKNTLDYFIENISSRKTNKLSPPVKNILRAAIYELKYLNTPDYAVINSYVNISKKYDKNSSKFVNAVLRNYLRKQNEIIFPDENENPIKHISTKYSHPEWLIEKWVKHYGQEETIKTCEFNNKVPPVSLRINKLKISKEELLDLLKENNIGFKASEISDECILLTNTGNIKNLAGYKEGFWAVQGECSSLVGKVLNPQKNETILDLCAAPGGKTAHIAALMQNTGEVVAVDNNQSRLNKINENCFRLGITSVKAVLSDAEIYSSETKFDRILIDAPCSNTGVFAKRPDARWKRTPEDLQELIKLQLKILDNAAKLLKVGGKIVYSTCSIEPEENLLMIERFLKNNRDFKLEDISEFLHLKDEGHSGYIQIIQSKYNTDGFFIAALRLSD